MYYILYKYSKDSQKVVFPMKKLLQKKYLIFIITALKCFNRLGNYYTQVFLLFCIAFILLNTDRVPGIGATLLILGLIFVLANLILFTADGIHRCFTKRKGTETASEEA